LIKKTLFSHQTKQLTQHLRKRKDFSDTSTFPLLKPNFLLELRCAAQGKFIAAKVIAFNPLGGISLSHVTHSPSPTLQHLKLSMVLSGA
jgi:hypothetical protein